MKLKYTFSVHPVAGIHCAVAIGKDAASFSGLVKMNDTGKAIFELLQNETTEDEIVSSLLETYDIDEASVRKEVRAFLDELTKNGILR